MDCFGDTYPECKITTQGEYYSITMCASWDFMESGTLEVENSIEEFNVGDIYTKCIQNIKYLYAGVNRYCIYCSIWRSGLLEDARTIKNFKIPNFYNNMWPVGTYTALSGINTSYGLVSLSNLNLITTESFEPNVITNVDVAPTTWYKFYKSMNFELSMTLTNNMYAGASIIIRSNTILPLNFMKTPNDYCTITNGDTE
jgi:hypothetical protein